MLQRGARARDASLDGRARGLLTKDVWHALGEHLEFGVRVLLAKAAQDALAWPVDVLPRDVRRPRKAPTQASGAHRRIEGGEASFDVRIHDPVERCGLDAAVPAGKRPAAVDQRRKRRGCDADTRFRQSLAERCVAQRDAPLPSLNCTLRTKAARVSAKRGRRSAFSAPLHAQRRAPYRACSQGARSREHPTLRQQHARDSKPERGARCQTPVQNVVPEARGSGTPHPLPSSRAFCARFPPKRVPTWPLRPCSAWWSRRSTRRTQRAPSSARRRRCPSAPQARYSCASPRVR